MDDSRSNPAIDTVVFPGTKSAGYWSSSTLAYGTVYAYQVFFLDGGVGLDSSKTFTIYVRCVR